MHSEINRHAQEIFTATIAAYLMNPKTGALTEDQVKNVAAQAIKQAMIFHLEAATKR